MNIKKQSTKTRDLTLIALMISLTLVLTFTPLGMIRTPVISITIAHIPAIIATILLGFYAGEIVALTFGLSSLFLAITSPASILDPFFVNPLISIFPRLLIPVTTYLVYKLLIKLFKNAGMGGSIAAVTAVATGNLTNTFGVYIMLYFIYAKQILEKSGTLASNLIIGAISTTTLIKCVAIVIITVPVILACKKAMNKNNKGNI